MGAFGQDIAGDKGSHSPLFIAEKLIPRSPSETPAYRVKECHFPLSVAEYSQRNLCARDLCENRISDRRQCDTVNYCQCQPARHEHCAVAPLLIVMPLSLFHISVLVTLEQPQYIRSRFLHAPASASLLPPPVVHRLEQHTWC